MPITGSTKTYYQKHEMPITKSTKFNCRSITKSTNPYYKSFFCNTIALLIFFQPH
jgi:hypothetical protein